MVSPAAGLTAIKTIPTIELILIVGMVLYIDNEFYVIQILESFYVEIIIFPVIFDYFRWSDPNVYLTAKSTNKFRYQANRAFIIGRIKSIVPKILCGLFELSIIEQLYTDAVRCRSQLLPGRSFPRKKLKSKGRSHFRNKKASF